MSNTFKNNSYHILGLNTSENQKSIIKRSKEILKLLEIDDLREYPLDLNIFGNFRTEESVKNAIQKLQMPKKKIKEYFFWFQIEDDVDREAEEYLRNNNYLSAIKTWDDSYKSLLHKKNLAILLTVIQTSDEYQHFLNKSVKLWKTLITSDSFWKLFQKIYELHEEETSSKEIINEFKTNVENDLSDVYIELFQLHKNKLYINEFQKMFSAKGLKTEKVVLEPAFEIMNEAIDILKKSLKLTEKFLFGVSEKKIIRDALTTFNLELEKLNELDLSDDSKTKSMRDKASDALQRITVSLSNRDCELEFCLELIDEGIKLAGTEGAKNELLQGREIVKQRYEYKHIIKPIEDEWLSEHYKKSYDKLNQYLAKFLADKNVNSVSEKTIIYLKELKSIFEKTAKKKGISLKTGFTTWKLVLFTIIGIYLLYVFYLAITNDKGPNSNVSNNVTQIKLPQQPLEDKSVLEATRSDLDNEESSLKALKNQINMTPVNQSSPQSDIDYYNSLVHKYNAGLKKYRADFKDFNARVDRYNSQIHR